MSDRQAYSLSGIKQMTVIAHEGRQRPTAGSEQLGCGQMNRIKTAQQRILVCGSGRTYGRINLDHPDSGEQSRQGWQILPAVAMQCPMRLNFESIEETRGTGPCPASQSCSATVPVSGFASLTNAHESR